MQRQKSHKKIKNNPQRPTHPSKNNQTKIEPDHSHNKHTLPHKKQSEKSDSRSKQLKKNSHPKSKHASGTKNPLEQQSIHMKQDLKNIMSKKETKNKYNDLVPHVLKNIQKNCKILQKLHEKEQKSELRKNSNQASRDKKEPIKVSNKSHEMRRKGTEKQGASQTFKANRFSMIVPTTNPKKKQTGSRQEIKEDNNFIELVKLYKKNFEIEEIKMDKSVKNTNYNTNQSRNSSSLYQSHGYSNALDYKNKNKSKLAGRVSPFEKVENLIKSQQNSAKKGVHSHSKAEKEEKVETGQELKQQQRKSRADNERHNQLMKQFFDCEVEQRAMNRKQLQKRFESSKFYVQHVPVGENSLLGCSITLLEDNLIEDESVLSQLQL